MTGTLAEGAAAVLLTGDPAAKAAAAVALAADWRTGRIAAVGTASPPERPARPPRPELRSAHQMPKRRSGGGVKARFALMHAVAHIELNAVDLACDIVARFAGTSPCPGAPPLPPAFFGDWIGVAGDEGRHFGLVAGRLRALGGDYGDLPAHDGLWQASRDTAHDLLARLAIVPMVFEARGLDVTPPMIDGLLRAGDPDSADVLRIILTEEVGHVAAGCRWFDHVATCRALPPAETWQALVRTYYGTTLKRPFNDEARARAGMSADWYQPLGGPAP